MNPRPKTVSLFPEHENPRVLLHKNWPGYAVIWTATRRMPMRVSIPSIVTIPLLEPLGPVSLQREIENLRAEYKRPCDVYVIYCQTPSGIRTHGMIAVPKALVPVVEAV